MATVLSQWTYHLWENPLPITTEQWNFVNFITGNISRIISEQQWKSLSEIIDTLYSELPRMEWITASEADQNGNVTVTIDDDIRLALALGITNMNTNNILLFGRKEGEKEYDASGNKNPLLDLPVAAKAILSKWSAVFKAWEDYLNQILQSLEFTGRFAYEKTDGQWDASHIIMPVFTGTTETNIQIPSDKKIQTISVQDFANMDPKQLTAKAEAYRQFIANTLM